MTSLIDPKHEAIDLGFMIRDWEATKAFYVDTVGFAHSGDMPFPLGTGGTMHRVLAGATTLKFTKLNDVPAATNPAGPITAAVGIRYLTFWITNLDEVFAACQAKGYATPVPVTSVRKGVRIFMVSDPDGNMVEFLQAD